MRRQGPHAHRGGGGERPGAQRRTSHTGQDGETLPCCLKQRMPGVKVTPAVTMYLPFAGGVLPTRLPAGAPSPTCAPLPRPAGGDAPPRPPPRPPRHSGPRRGDAPLLPPTPLEALSRGPGPRTQRERALLRADDGEPPSLVAAATHLGALVVDLQGGRKSHSVDGRPSVVSSAGPAGWTSQRQWGGECSGPSNHTVWRERETGQRGGCPACAWVTAVGRGGGSPPA